MNRSLWLFILAICLVRISRADATTLPSGAILLSPHQLSQFKNVNPQKFKILSQDVSWRSLLHTDKYGISRVRGSDFFLATRGSSDPQEELQATLDLMTSQNQEIAKNIQCRFPARREFLQKNFPEFEIFVQACEEREAWISKLGPEKLSIVFAAGYLNSAASSFGHTFLLVKKKDDRGELLNYAVNFSARTGDEDGALFALKGLFGFYPGKFALLPYHQLIKDYVNFEGRDLWEYEIDFSAEEIRYLIYHLFELEQGYFDYYFISQNCSHLLIELLHVVRPNSVYSELDPFFVIPIETLKKNQNLLKSEKFHPSMQSSLLSHWKSLSPRQQFYAKRLLAELLKSGATKNITTIKSSMSQETGFEDIKAEDWIPIIENLQLYSTMQENEGSLWKKVSFQLAIERSRLSGSGYSIGVPQPSSPLQSHDPSELRLGVLESKGLTKERADTNQETKLTVGWQPAYHDPASKSDGLAFGSELKILNVNFSFAENKSKLQSQVESYDLISLINPRPPQPFEWPLSWGIRWSGDRLENEGNLNHIFAGQLGYTLAPFSWGSRTPELLTSLFVKTEVMATEGSRFNDPRWGWGPSLWIHWSPSDRLRLSSELYANLDRTGPSEKRYVFSKLSLGFDLEKSLSLRIHRISRSVEKTENSQFQVEIVKDF